jgi:hypothetical protein
MKPILLFVLWKLNSAILHPLNIANLRRISKDVLLQYCLNPFRKAISPIATLPDYEGVNFLALINKAAKLKPRF